MASWSYLSSNYIWPCGHSRGISSIPIDTFSVSCFQCPIWVAFLLLSACVWFRLVAKGRLVPSIYTFCPLKINTFIHKKVINPRRSSHNLSREASHWIIPALYPTVSTIARDSLLLMIGINIQTGWPGFQRHSHGKLMFFSWASRKSNSSSLCVRRVTKLDSSTYSPWCVVSGYVNNYVQQLILNVEREMLTGNENVILGNLSTFDLNCHRDGRCENGSSFRFHWTHSSCDRKTLASVWSSLDCVVLYPQSL